MLIFSSFAVQAACEIAASPGKTARAQAAPVTPALCSRNKRRDITFGFIALPYAAEFECYATTVRFIPRPPFRDAFTVRN